MLTYLLLENQVSGCGLRTAKFRNIVKKISVNTTQDAIRLYIKLHGVYAL